MFLLQALESSSTLIIEFRAEEEKAIWLKGLIQATYQASVRYKISLLDLKCPNLFISLVLIFEICIYSGYRLLRQLMFWEEQLILSLTLVNHRSWTQKQLTLSLMGHWWRQSYLYMERLVFLSVDPSCQSNYRVLIILGFGYFSKFIAMHNCSLGGNEDRRKSYKPTD